MLLAWIVYPLALLALCCGLGPTFASYGKLEDISTWLAVAERAIEHGRSLEGLAPSTYRDTLDSRLSA